MSDALLRTVQWNSQDGDLSETTEWDPMTDDPSTINRNGTVEADVSAGEGYLPRRNVQRLPGAVHHDDASPPNDAIAGPVDYRVVGELGSGGTGIVYQAHQRAVDREVALKFLRDHLAALPRPRSRFLREARVIGSMDHPNVIAIHEVCLDQGGRPFYAMKRVDGTTWDRRMDELSESENVDVLLNVADAIRYAHSRGLIHRDIKPENVMMGRFGEVLLADWGLAISANRRDGTGREDSFGGTPAYMAPELAAGLIDSISYATDVYLLGAILYRIVTGKPPHHGETLRECIAAAADNLIQPTEVEGELVNIARRAMNTAPTDRFKSIDAFIAAIRSQRQQAESARLVQRARRRIEKSGDDLNLETITFIDSLLTEAIELWPGNTAAFDSRRELKLMTARQAAARGEYDLAISTYESIGMTAANAEVAEVLWRQQELAVQTQTASRLNTMFQDSPEAGLLLRMPDYVIDEVNRRFLELFGYEARNLIGIRISEMNLWVCPDSRGTMVDTVRRDGRIDDFETQFYRSDNSIVDVSIASRMTDIDGETVMISTIRDVTKRKSAERELIQSRQKLVNLQHMAGLATWSYDIARDEITWSDELFQLVGYDPNRGTPTRDEFYALVHPDDRGPLREFVQQHIATATAYQRTIRQRLADGNYHRVLIRGEPIVNDNGVVTEIYGVTMRPDAVGV